jgi:hypothetical protein
MNRCHALAAWALAIGFCTVTATLAQTGSALPAAAPAQDRVVVLRLP